MVWAQASELTYALLAATNGYILEADHPDQGTVKVIGSPIRMSATPTVPGVGTAELGQHTEEVLLEAGFSWDEIAQLQTDGAY